jgi:hypothetical protein
VRVGEILGHVIPSPTPGGRDVGFLPEGGWEVAMSEELSWWTRLHQGRATASP